MGDLSEDKKISIVTNTADTVSKAETGQEEIKIRESIKKLEKETEKITENFEKLKIEALQIKTDFEKLEGRTKSVNNFMYWAVGGIGVVFFLTGFTIALDYFHNKAEQYKEYLETTKNYYVKNEVDQKFLDFKNCIWFNGLVNCLK